MRLGINGEIILSKRNLLSLLHKVDQPTSARTLIAPFGAFVVMAEPDEAHYGDRKPGKMAPDTEKAIENYNELGSL